MITETIPTGLIRRFAESRHIVCFTGAGISAESNIPTFRGNEGIWSKFKPEELANFDAFMKNPRLVWEWYAARKKIIHDSAPNPGHYALVELERLVPRVTIVTQNIDNLHRRAGSSVIHELHGNIERNYCIACGETCTDEIMQSGELPPKCSSCGGLIRPDVVWFGEFLPQDAWNASEDAARYCDVCLSLGTSGVVYPAASIPRVAKESGAYLVEINPEPTPISECSDVTIIGRSGIVLPELIRSLRHLAGGALT